METLPHSVFCVRSLLLLPLDTLVGGGGGVSTVWSAEFPSPGGMYDGGKPLCGEGGDVGGISPSSTAKSFPFPCRGPSSTNDDDDEGFGGGGEGSGSSINHRSARKHLRIFFFCHRRCLYNSLSVSGVLGSVAFVAFWKTTTVRNGCAWPRSEPWHVKKRTYDGCTLCHPFVGLATRVRSLAPMQTQTDPSTTALGPTTWRMGC